MGKKLYEEADERLTLAIRDWNPTRPRRWLAKYGDLSCISKSGEEQHYRMLRSEAMASINRKKRSVDGDF